MAKITWVIAQAFTSGRKSAPAEFREVENQLYSLSAALAAFKDAYSHDAASFDTNVGQTPSKVGFDGLDGDQTVKRMLANCDETLRHPEGILKKYGIIMQDETEPSKPRLRRWNDEMAANYKKTTWTTQAGNLAVLRSQLLIHTNSLELVLSTIINSRTSRIEESLKHHSNMLRDIHSWWSENLKSVAQPDSSIVQSTSTGVVGSVVPTSTSPIVTFEVYEEVDQSLHLLCSHACLHEDWGETGSVQLFVCKCRQAGSLNPGNDHLRIEKIALSPLCFPFRQVGDVRSWSLFKAMDRSNNRLVSVVIKGIQPDQIFEFEESFVSVLSEARAEMMMRQGTSNMLAYMTPDEQAENSHSDLKNIHRFTESVTFKVGARVLQKPDIASISLLHYIPLELGGVSKATSHAEYAEILIDYGEATGRASSDITRSELHSARMLYERLEDMRKELFVLSLQYPRPDEKIALHLQAAQVQSEEVFIPDAELFIVRSQQDKFRLIIVSRNKCTILSQVLADNFFSPQPAAGSGVHTTANFASLTYLVQLEGVGTRKVYRFDKGFKHLSFHSLHYEKMFELSQAALSQTGTMLIRNKDDADPDTMMWI
ncbi:hypothetical protein B0T17DRAFT_481035 [Bombardia bombarda]|uniref:Uncharacterized protein n=1 Tax=Bombardia bombarda TaxID=252184 RepID=A0AA39XN98_9PEZI|nr:hypothetical protein B0T17DRAFT_481035 [Bombardia bombarda]